VSWPAFAPRVWERCALGTFSRACLRTSNLDRMEKIANAGVIESAGWPQLKTARYKYRDALWFINRQMVIRQCLGNAFTSEFSLQKRSSWSWRHTNSPCIAPANKLRTTVAVGRSVPEPILHCLASRYSSHRPDVGGSRLALPFSQPRCILSHAATLLSANYVIRVSGAADILSDLDLLRCIANA